MTKITRYRQSLYQDWKDGEITRQEYRDMKADYERQAAGLADVPARLIYENGNISVHFKFADEFRRIAEYIEISIIHHKILSM